MKVGARLIRSHVEAHPRKDNFVSLGGGLLDPDSVVGERLEARRALTDHSIEAILAEALVDLVAGANEVVDVRAWRDGDLSYQRILSWGD